MAVHMADNDKQGSVLSVVELLRFAHSKCPDRVRTVLIAPTTQGTENVLIALLGSLSLRPYRSTP